LTCSCQASTTCRASRQPAPVLLSVKLTFWPSGTLIAVGVNLNSEAVIAALVATGVRGHGERRLRRCWSNHAGAARRAENHAMHYFFDIPVAPCQTIRKPFPRTGEFVYHGGLSCSISRTNTIKVRAQ
jgi:hypothetical protein